MTQNTLIGIISTFNAAQIQSANMMVDQGEGRESLERASTT
jgi:hypothetical protein